MNEYSGGLIVEIYSQKFKSSSSSVWMSCVFGVTLSVFASVVMSSSGVFPSWLFSSSFVLFRLNIKTKTKISIAAIKTTRHPIMIEMIAGVLILFAFDVGWSFMINKLLSIGEKSVGFAFGNDLLPKLWENSLLNSFKLAFKTNNCILNTVPTFFNYFIINCKHFYNYSVLYLREFAFFTDYIFNSGIINRIDFFQNISLNFSFERISSSSPQKSTFENKGGFFVIIFQFFLKLIL